jgi:UDP-N-acetylmuramyl pentapeptide synthase
MISTDHFRQELTAQLARAVKGGRLDVLINSGELCRSVQNGGASAASCCDAMEAEMKTGDTLLVERSNGAGLTVRYLLPRLPKLVVQ